MSSLGKERLESALRAKRSTLDQESDRRLSGAVAKTPADVGSSAYSWKDYLNRLTDVFRIEEEKRVSEAQSVLMNEIGSHIDQVDGDIAETVVAVLDDEGTRIRDRFAALWNQIVPSKISSPNPQDATLQQTQQGLVTHADASRYWRGLDIQNKVQSLKSASDLYKANMKAAEANEAAAHASEASARAAEKMVIWTRWVVFFTAVSALGTLGAAIATAFAAWHGH